MFPLSRALSCCLMALGLSGCAAALPVFPGASWETIPAPGANCRRDLDATGAYLQSLSSTALMAEQDGRVLFSYGPVEQAGYIFSARKSILAMMYGKYVENGSIELDATLAELGIDDIGGLLPIEGQARVRDLLTARSGVYHLAANPGDDAGAAPPRGSQAPGSYFLYNNWDFNAAGTVFERQTGRGIYQAFAQDLAAPLQLEDFDPGRQRYSGDGSKSRHLAYHFYLSTRDMARLGHLMLQHGNWRGQQLIPAQWATTITTPVTKAADMHPGHTARRGLDYAILWWTLDQPADSPLHGAYMAWGVYGQFILVLPQRHMVIAHKRDVPLSGREDARWVQLKEFLHAATMLAKAPCQ
ncbi:CubicO group peptidase (beta-lactamase class C family) [Oxalobacteraceae bacterium GrIS 1.11]